jgi:hypothetical protein
MVMRSVTFLNLRVRGDALLGRGPDEPVHLEEHRLPRPGERLDPAQQLEQDRHRLLEARPVVGVASFQRYCFVAHLFSSLLV